MQTLKRLVFGIVVLLITACGGGSSSSGGGGNQETGDALPETYHGILIDFDQQEHVEKVKRSIDLVRETGSLPFKGGRINAWEFVNGRVKEIVLAETGRSGVFVAQGRYQVTPTDISALGTTRTFFAGNILHEAVHVWQYRTGRRFPSCKEAELEAFELQIAALYKWGATSEARYAEERRVASLDGSHCLQ